MPAIARVAAALVVLLAAVPGRAADIGGWMAARQGDAGVLEAMRRRAEQGHAASQYELALAYQEGHGVPADPAAAAGWLRIAAENGFGPAEMRLGAAYQTGVGVSRNPLEAWAWYDLAAGHGVEGAAAARDQLAGDLQPGQLAAARVLADSRRGG